MTVTSWPKLSGLSRRSPPLLTNVSRLFTVICDRSIDESLRSPDLKLSCVGLTEASSDVANVARFLGKESEVVWPNIIGPVSCLGGAGGGARCCCCCARLCSSCNWRAWKSTCLGGSLSIDECASFPPMWDRRKKTSCRPKGQERFYCSRLACRLKTRVPAYQEAMRGLTTSFRPHCATTLFRRALCSMKAKFSSDRRAGPLIDITGLRRNFPGEAAAHRARNRRTPLPAPTADRHAQPTDRSL